MKTHALAAVVALAAASLLAAPAHAGAPLSQQPYGGSSSFTDCGYPAVSVFSGTVTILDTNPSLDGQFFRFTNRYRFTETFTNPATGETLTVSAGGVFKEIQPRSQGDGVFAYTTHDAGHLTIKDSTGAVLVREAGLIVSTLVFDTGNDGQPGGEVLSDDLSRIAGPHATFAPDFDFCALVEETIG